MNSYNPSCNFDTHFLKCPFHRHALLLLCIYNHSNLKFLCRGLQSHNLFSCTPLTQESLPTRNIDQHVINVCLSLFLGAGDQLEMVTINPKQQDTNIISMTLVSISSWQALLM